MGRRGVEYSMSCHQGIRSRWHPVGSQSKVERFGGGDLGSDRRNLPDVAPTILHVAPHPDDEAVGCPGALLHLLDRGWTVVSVIASLGFAGQWERRRAEAEEAAQRAGFVPVFLDPPLNLDLDADLALATRRVANELPGIVEEHDASIVVSPSPHDVHHGHETVGRGVQRAMAALPPTLRWWMWGVWGDLPAPNVFYGFDRRCSIGPSTSSTPTRESWSATTTGPSSPAGRRRTP